MLSNEKLAILKKRNLILKKLNTYIDEDLNPARCNVFDPLKEGFQEPKIIDAILDHLSIRQRQLNFWCTGSSDPNFWQIKIIILISQTNFYFFTIYTSSFKSQ